jgi:hypothetical protein
MIHLMTRAEFCPGNVVTLLVARCGFRSCNVKHFGKVKSWITNSLAGVTCPDCLKGLCR